MKKKSNAGSPKESLNILILGHEGSGKTTLLASLIHYINSQKDLVLSYDMNNKNGFSFLIQIWQETLVKGQFPPRENVLKSETVDISLKPVDENVSYRLKFSELSTSFPLKEEIGGDEDDGPDDYIDSALAADMVILTFTAEAIKAGENDLAVSIFFQILQEHKIELPIILVITQCDRVEEVERNRYEFVKSGMPSTYKWLKYGYFPETRIARFSVGEVSPEPYEDRLRKVLVDYLISSLNIEDSGEIFHWIFEYLKKKSAVGDEEGTLRQELRENLSRLSREPENIDILRETRGIYLELGEEAEAEEVEKKLNRLIEKKEYKSNLGKRIYLRQMEVQGLDFFGKFRWVFQPGMNVLLGRNGYGKSHLLRFLATLLQKDELKSSEFFEHSKAEPFARLTVEREGSQEAISRNQLVFEESIGRVPLLAIPDMRSLDQSRTVVSYAGDGKEMDLSQQWCYHFLYQKPVEGLIQDFLYQLCITYLDRGKTFKLPIFRLIHKVAAKLPDHPFRFHEIEPIGQARFKIDVITEGNQHPIPIQKASQGTLSVLAIFGLIYSYLQSVFRKMPEEDLPNQPAIVLIDEIDAHLHPSWQQRLIGLLRESFPHVQFIVTAHSPLVVAGCKEGEVAVLRREKDGFGVRLFEQDFIGYEASELYKKVFEIEEKDDAYLYYNALYPFREEIEKEIRQLEKAKAEAGKGFSTEEEQKLNQLYDDLYYSRKANERLNRKLKDKIKKLKNGGQAVG